MKKYKHSEVFAEIKAIKEDIEINLTSLQYLQILDYYIGNSLHYLSLISPKFFDNYLSKVIAYQQIHAMSKLSSESREKISCLFFNYITTRDVEYLKKLYLNRGLYLGIVSYWLNHSRVYFEQRSPFYEGKVEEDNVLERLGIENPSMYFAYFKAIEYWFNKALDFKGKIMQKYTRMTLLQAQKTYVEYNHVVELDDVTQIYLQIMSKAIDRCDSRFGVLTTFIQSWLKSAKAIVQKNAQSINRSSSYESLLEDFGDSVTIGTSDFNDEYDTFEEICYYASLWDKTGCLRIKYHIPQFLTDNDRQLLMSYAQ